jgi:hypothetical protein
VDAVGAEIHTKRAYNMRISRQFAGLQHAGGTIRLKQRATLLSAEFIFLRRAVATLLAVAKRVDKTYKVACWTNVAITILESVTGIVQHFARTTPGMDLAPSLGYGRHGACSESTTSGKRANSRNTTSGWSWRHE